MSTVKARTRRWSRREYEHLINQGFFRPDERLELLDGQLVVKEPQDPRHVTAIELVVKALRDAFGPGWQIRPQFPVALARWSEPEPDVCVVPGSPRDYRDAHPTLPVLVIEVAYTRLRFDRTRKASIYARAGVSDYWIVNLPECVLEVHRDPGRLAIPRRRWGYRAIQTVGIDDLVAPLAAPFARVAVADLLP
jgi:Uma2 family endonuclease